MRPLLVAGATLALLAGCGGDDGDEQDETGAASTQRGCREDGLFTVSPDEVAPGEAIALTVENPSAFAKDITYGLGGQVDIATEDGWKDATEALANTAVPDIAIVLSPGESSSVTQGATADVIELSPEAQPGDYRVVKKATAGKTSLSSCARFTVTE